jgi:hypothetical protein
LQTKFDELDIMRTTNPFAAAIMSKAEDMGDVISEFHSNPMKFTSFNNLAISNPRMAQREFDNMLASLKARKEAMKKPVANPPLSQVTPSHVPASNGNRRVKDLINSKDCQW